MILIMSSLISSIFDDGSPTSLEKNDLIFQSGENVRLMYLVVEGRVDLLRYTESGACLLLFRAGPGHVLAEASAYSKTYHCDGRAVSPAHLRSISIARFQNRLSADVDMAKTWAKGLAHSLQAARMSSEIRTLRTVAERLDAWLAGSGSLPPKGEWQDLAQALGVTREALYRELSKRRS